MNNTQVLAHTSFLGTTGYNAHSQNFFISLNKLIPVRVRNYTYTKKFSEFEKENLHLLIQQDWQDPPYKIGKPFIKDPNTTYVNIVLNESHHYFFYDQYESPMIAYNVWESTKQIPEFFNRILEFDQFWCPTEWQRRCTIEQGYPEDRVKVVPEGVNGNLFRPFNSSSDRLNIKKKLYEKYGISEDKISFMIFGRWDYRKSVQEICEMFFDTFQYVDNVVLIISADNPFSTDGLESTEERLEKLVPNYNPEKTRILHFPEREEYINWIRSGDVFLSCSRAEGWNLPLMEAIASGTPSIYSGWGAQQEFAQGIGHEVIVSSEKSPKKVFMIDKKNDLGVWGEPDFDHLELVLHDVHKHINQLRSKSEKLSKYIRELYTWENAAIKAKRYIDELVSKKSFQVPDVIENIDKGVKLNLGCGNEILDGYINIDRYNNTASVDLACDLGALPFPDESVDEIYTAHVFEHIGINDVYGVLDEWRRALRPHGRLKMYLPNLEHEVRLWLDTPDDRKWFEVHRIFGAQSHEGNTHFSGHNPASLKLFLESFDFEVTHCDVGNRGFGEEIQCVAKKKQTNVKNQSRYFCHFIDGPFVDIQGDPNDKSYYLVDFVDPDSKANVHQQLLKINHWTRPYRKWFTNWLVQVRKNGKLEYEHKFDLKGKLALISFDSKSLGDSIAWIPAVEEFRKKHECEVVVSTFWNELFEESYPNLQFVSPGSSIKNLYASYTIGCYEGDKHKNKFDWRTVPLQKVAFDILGLDYKEIIADLAIKPGERIVKEKFVTISEFSTFQCKFWNCHDGWQTIVDWLNKIGYRVVVVSKEETKLKNVIDRTNCSIKETITNIYHSEFFIGVSAGPAWIAWALRKPAVMISGYSMPWAEFTTNIERVINTDVCHGCFNDINNNFDRGQWYWCPRHRGTEREFECTIKITPEDIKHHIIKIAQHNNIKILEE